VRAIAPFVKDKKEDPAVVCMDQKGENVISLLSGHAGGANQLAESIATFTGGKAIVTAATDSNSLTAIDLFAAENGLPIENPELLAETSSAHIENANLRIYSDTDIPLPVDYVKSGRPEDADAIISNRIYPHKAVYLRPLNLVVGIGLNAGTEAGEIEFAVAGLFRKERLSPCSIRLLATHQKKLDEQGLREFAERHGLRLRGFTTVDLNGVEGVGRSDAAMRALGVQAVAEPAALLGANSKELLVKKRKIGNLTLAVAEATGNILYVVGTGPGGLDHLTPRALRAIKESDVIVGFRSYLNQIEPLTRGKELVSSAMTEEVARAKAAVELAASGRKVCVISGGDPGIYGMAGLVMEVACGMDAPVEVEVIPGISALNACAARLGAPLMHDFASISLSDRLTPWELIEERLDAAARADFVIVLYNPKSRGRTRQIERAREITMRHRAVTTPVGIVKSSTRRDEEIILTDLKDMLSHEIDMHSTVIIGNSNTRRIGLHLVTPRGYERKYAL
jgi:cobalt-precorrin 5A hydrolase/precorrin-3B C17-methyltransferase